MTVLDDKLVPKTLAIIDKFGRNATFTELTTNTPDPTTGTVTQVEVEHVRKITPPSEYNDRYMSLDHIDIGDAKVLVAASAIPFTPIKAMKVVIDSNTWKIVRVSPISSGASIAAYELQLRK